MELGEGEHRRLDIAALFLRRIQVEDALLLEARAEDDVRGDVRELIARGLRQKRHRARRAGVDLDDVDMVALIDDELDVIQSDDADAQTELLGIGQDRALDLVGDGKRRVDADGVAGVDTGALDQLHDAGHEHVSAVADGVDLDLAAGDVLIDQHGLALAGAHGILQIVAQHLVVGHDLHGAAAQHERRAHQHRIAHRVRSLETVVQIRHRCAHRLRDVQLEQQLFKAVAVLRALDRGAVRADDLYTARHERLRQIDGRLAAEAGDHLIGLLLMQNVHDVLGREGLEIQLIGGRVVGRDRLGVVVDDDGLIARAPDGLHRVDGGVVKLHALTDADRTRAEHDDLLLVRAARLALCAGGIGGVEIGDVSAGVAGVHHLVGGVEPQLHALGIHILLAHAPEPRDVGVTEAHLLGPLERLSVALVRAERLLHVHDAADGLEEVGRDHRQCSDLVHARAQTQQLRDGKEPVIAELVQVLGQLRLGHVLELRQPEVLRADLQRADGLEQALLERAADAHDLACGLHLRAERVGGGRELIEREARQLCDHVVQRRLERGRRVGDGDLVEVHADGDLGRDARDGIAAGLARQRRRAGDAGVDLNEEVLRSLGVERKLHVAAALDLQRADDLDRAVVEHLHVMVAERHDRRDDGGVAGVHAHGVDVLHAADGDGAVGRIAHDLKLDFLIALDALFDQHLMDGRELERLHAQLDELRLVVGKAAARAAERERRAQHDRIADGRGRGLGLLEVVGDLRRDDRLADALAELLELLAVLGTADAVAVRAEKLDLALLEHALLLELHRQIQAGLAADARDDRVRALLAQDTRHILQRQRLHVHLVRDGGIRHDRGGVGVDENDLVPLLLERQARLRAGIVKLSGLTDDDRAGADDHNFLQIRSLGHVISSSVRKSPVCHIFHM